MTFSCLIQESKIDLSSVFFYVILDVFYLSYVLPPILPAAVCRFICEDSYFDVFLQETHIW